MSVITLEIVKGDGWKFSGTYQRSHSSEQGTDDVLIFVLQVK
jgi:hypothetical protein